MTPEQITIRSAESLRDLRLDAFAAGWSVRYPGSLDVEGESEELELGPASALSVRARVFKVVGVLLLIVALLAYLAVPFNAFVRTQVREQGPIRARPIPVAPQHESEMLGV